MPAMKLELDQVMSMISASPPQFRIDTLLDFSKRVPPLPPEFDNAREQLEKVHECQTPFFLTTRLENGGVRLYFDAPPEAPTVRAFAGILTATLDGKPAEEILALPTDYFYGKGLEEVVSPLRLRGVEAIIFRLKRQVSAALAEREQTTTG